MNESIDEPDNKDVDSSQFDDPQWGSSQLRKISFLGSIEDGELEEIYTQGKIIKKKVQSHIIIEGEKSRGLFILLKGNISIFKSDNSKNLIRLALLEKGDFFGEMSLFDDAPRSATAVAESNCELFYLDHQSFDSFLDSKEDNLKLRFYKRCAEEMAERFRAQNSDYIIAQQLIWEHALRKKL
tara:strand:+ start:575 stop:1123 length:549 start_codon:yes stop_codon:yes gene_type:complete